MTITIVPITIGIFSVRVYYQHIACTYSWSLSLTGASTPIARGVTRSVPDTEKEIALATSKVLKELEVLNARARIIPE